MQRVHRMQRSASKRMVSLQTTFFGLATFASPKRLSPEPYWCAKSWSLHSPAWSQIGQSRGWLTSRNSITPARALVARGLCVSTTIPSATGVPQAIGGFGAPFTSTRQIRQFPSTRRRGW
jgi:hypothetical protein